MDTAEFDYDWIIDPQILRGRSLRYLLVDILMTYRQATVAEMVTLLAERGHTLNGRPSKVISDALRWEIGHGRVVRVSRGVYRLGRVSRSTRRRVRLLAYKAAVWMQLTARKILPPPFPHDPRQPYPPQPCTNRNPCSGTSPCRCGTFPPWCDLNWLWAL
jgi:hypothetical protein